MLSAIRQEQLNEKYSDVLAKIVEVSYEREATSQHLDDLRAKEIHLRQQLLELFEKKQLIEKELFDS